MSSARRLLIGLVGLIGLAAAAVFVARGSLPSAPRSDIAVIESYAHLTRSALVDVGPYSRFGWHHPGPLFIYLEAPFYAAAGDRTAGLQAGALVINVLAVATLLWTLFAAGERSMAACAAIGVGMFVWRAPELLTSPWNPHVLVLPTLAFVGVSAAVMTGAVTWLPAATVFATFVTQTHVGLAPVVLVVSAGVILSIADRFVRSQAVTERAHIRNAFALSAALALVLWSLPLFDVFVHQGGNLGAIWRFFASESHRTQPAGDAYRIWAAVFGAWPTAAFTLATGVPQVVSRAAWLQLWSVGQLALLLVVAAWSAASGRRMRASISVLLFLTALVAMWSVSRIEETVMDHEVFWMSAIGLLTTVVVFDALVVTAFASQVATRFAAGLAAVTCALVVIGIAAIGLVNLRANRDRWSAGRPEGVAIVAMSGELERTARARQWTRPLFLFDQVAWEDAAGVLLQLQKAGIDFAVERDWLPMYTRASEPSGHETPIIALSGPARHATLLAVAGVTPIAAHGALFADLVPDAASVPAAP